MCCATAWRACWLRQRCSPHRLCGNAARWTRVCRALALPPRPPDPCSCSWSCPCSITGSTLACVPNGSCSLHHAASSLWPPMHSLEAEDMDMDGHGCHACADALWYMRVAQRDLQAERVILYFPQASNLTDNHAVRLRHVAAGSGPWQCVYQMWCGSSTSSRCGTS